MSTLRKRTLLIAMIAGLTTATFAPSLLAIEEPEYRVIDTIAHADGVIEVREYTPMNIARTRVTGEFLRAGHNAFPRLGGYIFGDNIRNEKIDMTAPVAQHADESGGYWVSFVMPSAYSLDTLPLPDNASVELISVPARTMAVAKYRGGWSTGRYERHAARLTSAVSDSARWRKWGTPEWARYNPPMWPSFLKRNEIMLPVRDMESLTAHQ
tara:strand:+ start:244 stop:876 length:633 start_codon:yes stop_codon:yes gene_type:complete